ncbi:beta/gamma crystallin domain-containing protein [Micromonospora sp. M12]
MGARTTPCPPEQKGHPRNEDARQEDRPWRGGGPRPDHRASGEPALAINSVSCGTRTDFLKLDITLGNIGMAKCFASRGVTAVDIGSVFHYTSGNNKVTVNYEAGGRYYTSTVDRGYGVSFGRVVRVYEVRIW